MTTQSIPVYLDGEPQNLAAAANDALDWLKLIQKHIRQIRGQLHPPDHLREDERRIAAAIAAIESFVDTRSPIYKHAGEPDPAGHFEVIHSYLQARRQSRPRRTV